MQAAFLFEELKSLKSLTKQVIYTNIFEWKNFLYSHFYFHPKNIFTFKKSFTFPNLLLEKAGNLFAAVFSFCLCKSTTWFLRKRNIDSKWVIPNNYRVKNINRLHQTTPSWWIVPFKNRKPWTFCELLKLAISYYSRIWKCPLLSTITQSTIT